jgi:hypothetical protein
MGLSLPGTRGKKICVRVKHETKYKHSDSNLFWNGGGGGP